MFTPVMMQAHELIGLDVHGQLCACGVRGSFLEHLGEVAQVLLEVPPLSFGARREAVAEAKRRERLREDREWMLVQGREANLKSFQVQPKPRRKRGPNIPVTVFEDWQMEVALRVFAA